MIFLLAVLLAACTPSAPAGILPGEWMGDVEESAGAYIDIDTELHLQLWEVEGRAHGWTYHVDGTWIVQEQYETAPCEPSEVSGGLQERDYGYHISCMQVGSNCLTVDLTPDTATIDLGDVSMGVLPKVDLSIRIEPPEDGLEIFQCQK